MKTISTKECAAMIRECLKQGFPKTKFSVRMTRSTYSHNIDAYWTDGPTQKQVKPILDRFVSKGFDGMTDSSYSCGKRTLAGVEVKVSGNYVSGHRSISSSLRMIVATKLATECGISGVELNESGYLQNAEQHVPFAWHQHWETGHWTLEEFRAKKYILSSDANGRGEWLSQLICRVENNISLEEQQPIDPALLPEYIDIQATVSTGRAEEFEERQKMFEGHAALDAEVAAVQEFEQAPVSTPAPAIEFNCSVGRSYPRAQSITEIIQ